MSKRFLLQAGTFLSSTLLITLAPQAAEAGPIVLSAAVSAAASTALAYATSAITGTVLAYAAKSFFLSAAAGYALNALSPKPKGPTQPAQSAILVSGVSPASDHAIIYGKTRVGGVIVYKEATDNNKFLHIVVALAGHEIEEIETVYLNDEALTLDGDGFATAPSKYNGLVRINKHNGSATQAADADLITESAGLWTADHRLQGVAYLYARLEFNADAFPNGEPNITAVVKGRKFIIQTLKQPAGRTTRLCACAIIW